MAIEVSSQADVTESFAPLERVDAYEEWQQSEGVPVVAGFYIENLNTLDLGSWQRIAGSGFAAGNVRRATAAGASAKYTFTGRAIAWVTTRGPDHGAVRIYVDGTLVGTVDARATTPGFRFIAWSRTWASSGTHTLRLVVVGTASRPRADVDAFEILR